MKPRPKSVVLDVLSTLKGRAAPVRLLVAVAEIFEIDSNATRVAITRLLASGLIERDERGAYRTGEAAAPILRRLGTWRNINRRTRPWTGQWVGATPDAGLPAKEHRALSVRALEFSGMREFSPGMWVRPDNIEGGIVAVREALRGLRLPKSCPVFGIHGCDETCDAHARSLWNAEEIIASYRNLTAELEESGARLPKMSESESMAESFLLGGQAIRSIVLDPLLPDEIVPIRERDELVRAMRAYDLLGRRCWAPFLDRYGVLVGEPPMDRQVWRDAASGGGVDYTTGELS